MAKRKSFAVVDKATDTFLTMERAEQKADLQTRYPDVDFDLHDMDGKDDIPKKDGAHANDLTVDANGEWKWKVTDVEIAQRQNNARKETLRNQLLVLLGQKEQADAQGPEFIDMAVALQARIDDIQAELAIQ